MELTNVVRIGTVHSVDAAGKKVRVKYEDLEIISGWLFVLQHSGAGVTVAESGLHTHPITGSETISDAGQHTHTAQVAAWLPAVGDKVLVIYIPVFNGDGFVLGAI